MIATSSGPGAIGTFRTWSYRLRTTARWRVTQQVAERVELVLQDQIRQRLFERKSLTSRPFVTGFIRPLIEEEYDD